MTQRSKPEQQWVRSALFVVFLASLIFVTGCGTKPVEPEPVLEICDTQPNSLECFCDESPESPSCSCLTSPDSNACFCASSENENTLRCLCHRDPLNLACQEAPSCPADKDATALIIESLNQSNFGDWEAAEQAVVCALELEPANVRAIQIQVQLEQGADYFQRRGTTGEHKYLVKPGESLGTIARDCLKNTDLFVALAKFNGIDIPGSLKVGAQIRIPGNKECGGNADQMLQDALKEEEKGNFKAAWRLVWQTYQVDKREVVRTANDRIQTKWADKLVGQGLEIVDTDCKAARKNWTQAKRVDPDHVDATFYLEQVPCD